MSLSLRPAHLSRYRQIASLLVRHGRSDLVRSAGLDELLEETGEGVDHAEAEALANDLEAMGPTFIKLGQLLSSRVDLLPEAYTEALARLQDSVEPFGFAEVEEIVGTELGARMSRLFEDFEAKPIAAASLGQVHRATLRGGRPVVVKVQRPGVRRQVYDDMEVLGELADFLDAHAERARRLAVGDLLEQFRRSLVDELDYRREAANLTAIREVLAGYDRLVVPRPYDDLTTSRVLTMEYVDGRKVTDVGPLGMLEVDGAGLADELFRAYLDQVLDKGLFHADPHPGNVLLTRDGRLAVIDLGMVARIGDTTRDQLLKLLVAIGEGRSDEVARMAHRLGEELPGFDRAALDRAVADVVGRASGASVRDLDAGALVLQLTRRAAEAGLRITPELAMLGKALLNLDQVAATLDPDFEPMTALRRHAPEIVRSGMSGSPRNLLSAALEAKEFAEELPGRLNRAMDAVADGRFEVQVRAFDEVEFLRGLHKLANVVAAGLILTGLMLGSAILARGSGEVAGGIALAVFVIAALAGLGLLARIGWTSRGVEPRSRNG
jgi:predicted unusual protein kinase regulating ubiquinone biosynthesis (AarF/ABC1/UbiB family)